MMFQSIGYNFQHDKNFSIVRQNGLHEYLLLIIRSSSMFVLKNKEMQLTPNSMIILKKHSPHSFGSDGSVYVNDWVTFTFNSDTEGYLFDKILFDRFVESKKLVDECSNIVKLMQTENLNENTDKNIILNLLFKVVILKFKSGFDDKINDPHYNAISEIRKFIINTPTEKYSTQKLADMAYMSKSYFQHLYKYYFHTTPINDVILSKINYSKQLLFTTNYSVKTISEMLNYNNDIQFIKQFKQFTGETPGQYRNHFSD